MAEKRNRRLAYRPLRGLHQSYSCDWPPVACIAPATFRQPPDGDDSATSSAGWLLAPRGAAARSSGLLLDATATATADDSSPSGEGARSPAIEPGPPALSQIEIGDRSEL